MSTCLGKSCSFGLLCVSFVNVYQFVRAILSLLVLRRNVGFDCISSRSLIFFLLSIEHSLSLPPTDSPGPEVIKLFSCSTQLSMKYFPLINVKMPTIVGILTCMSGKITF